jgi:hypothetical protein
MVPFEFASVLLLVAMIERSYCLKKKNRNNMNNILNEIGIETTFSFDTFFVLVFGVLYRRNAIIVFMSVEIMLNAVNLLFVAFLLITKMHKDKFSSFLYGCSCWKLP